MVLDEYQETIESFPNVRAELILRGKIDSETSGEASIGAGTEVAPGLDVTAGVSRHWEHLGRGEYVLRLVHDPREP
jgi:hypothetical protein